MQKRLILTEIRCCPVLSTILSQVVIQLCPVHFYGLQNHTVQLSGLIKREGHLSTKYVGKGRTSSYIDCTEFISNKVIG